MFEKFDENMYGNYTVHTRKVIDNYFLNTTLYVSDWVSVDDSDHYDHMYLKTHYIRIDVYYDIVKNCPIIMLSVRDVEYINFIQQFEPEFKSVLYITVNTATIDDLLSTEFDDTYTYLLDRLEGIEYRIENFEFIISNDK